MNHEILKRFIGYKVLRNFFPDFFCLLQKAENDDKAYLMSVPETKEGKMKIGFSSTAEREGKNEDNGRWKRKRKSH